MARNSNKPARDIHQEVTDKIVAQLEAGTRPWIKPWNAENSAGAAGIALPRRVNGQFYRGINTVLRWVEAQDEVRMPVFEAFSNAERYYDTLGHECVHWSGAAHRLNRNLKGRFGDQDYGREELVAEMGAAFLSAILGISSEPRPDHASYLAS